jgi:hypothetical protein
LALPDDLDERPTILRVKRRHGELALDIIVVEAEQPVRKKRTMKALSEALQGLKMAEELHTQFQAHLKSTTVIEPSTSQAVPSSSDEKPVVPPPIWSAPSKTLEKQMRKVFRLIGSDHDSKTLINDVQSGRAGQRDILHAISKRTYDKERKARAEAFHKKISDQRSYHLMRVQQEIQRLPNEPVDNDEGMCRIIELVSKDKDEIVATPVKPARPSDGAQLPVVYSARKLKQMEQQRLAAKAAEKSDFETVYYVLDDEAPLADLGEFNPVQVPLSEFKNELLDDFVLEGEYSDSDKADSSDSQNRSEEWEYGSDPSDDGKEELDAGSRGSSEEEDSDDEKNASGDDDEMMDEDGDYYHDRYKNRGYNFEMDPRDLPSTGPRPFGLGAYLDRYEEGEEDGEEDYD